jgi:hypothetical protein
MQQERYTFNRFPNIRNDEPMGETKFWGWMDENCDVDGNSTYTNAIQRYLEPYGFDIKKYFLPIDQVEVHRIVFECFWGNKLREERKNAM